MNQFKPGDLVRVEHKSDFPVAVIKQVDDLGITVRYLCDGLRTASDEIAVRKGDVSVVDADDLREVGPSEAWWREELERETDD